MAQRLITAREKDGPFTSRENLKDRVPGLGMISIKNLPAYGVLLSFEEAEPVRGLACACLRKGAAPSVSRASVALWCLRANTAF